MTGIALGVLEERNLELGPNAAKKSRWKNWRLTRDASDTAWLILDKQGSSANILAMDVLRELSEIIAELEASPAKGLVIRSGKTSGFVAGADITEFGVLTDEDAIATMLTEGNKILDRLDALPFTTIAVIHGFCLGGGLELALACDRRIAIDGARFGFPEVLLGLHPGLGGTWRSTKLINPVEAMSMMLTGRTVHARAAKAIGLVDAVTEERHVLNAVKAAVDGSFRLSKPALPQRIIGSLAKTSLGRRLAAKRMRAEAESKAPKQHYPAPYALIDMWEDLGGEPKNMKDAEVASFAKLLTTDTAKSLVRVFFLRENLKKLAGKGEPMKHVHVIGAGAMGGDIAAWCAWQGISVSLADMQAKPLAKAVGKAASLFGKIGKKSRLTRDALDRMIPDLHGDGVARADLVIEAVPENLEIKKKVYAVAEQRMKPDAILATNTSSIPLEILRQGLARPERLVGIHFFNPVSRMQLVEVVSHDGSSKETLAAARAFVGQIDRLPAPVKSAPGFVVNRALLPYMLEAMVVLDEGVKAETIDRAAEEFGMPMGPIELADQVGLDICLHVAEVLKEALNWPMPDPPQWLRDKVAAGELGAKTGRGIYVWKDGKAVKAKDVPDAPEGLTDRLILPMVNVCVTLLREGVAESEDVIDGAMIFGTGFAPFRGGPLHYARMRGVPDVTKKLRELAKANGPRFQPDDGWDLLK
jgi:3-hydroxyacyl-CoA dehydrogenase/enoyl-CoA hydratase/3-hydroxybutyryl-CoA epimerase